MERKIAITVMVVRSYSKNYGIMEVMVEGIFPSLLSKKKKKKVSYI